MVEEQVQQIIHSRDSAGGIGTNTRVGRVVKEEQVVGSWQQQQHTHTHTQENKNKKQNKTKQNLGKIRLPLIVGVGNLRLRLVFRLVVIQVGIHSDWQDAFR